MLSDLRTALSRSLIDSLYSVLEVDLGGKGYSSNESPDEEEDVKSDLGLMEDIELSPSLLLLLTLSSLASLETLWD